MNAKTTTPATPEEERYERFVIRYPSGTVLDSWWLIPGGGTVRAVEVEHPLGRVEPVEASRVPVEGGL